MALELELPATPYRATHGDEAASVVLEEAFRGRWR